MPTALAEPAGPPAGAAPAADVPGDAPSDAAPERRPARHPGDAAAPPEVVIEARSGWRGVGWAELHAYRDLLRFLIWRGVKARYAQSAIGIGWAVIQPLTAVVIFTVVFGRMANLDSDGVPYLPFCLVGLLPWTYFRNCLIEGTASLVSNANMISKVYFPRLVLPFSTIVGKLVDLAIGAVVLAGVLAWYGLTPTWGALLAPALLFVLMVASAGVACWLTALAIQFRDVQYASTYLVQLLMYSVPVVYSLRLVPEEYRLLYALNPLVGVIEGLRAGLLGTRDMPWDLIAVGTASAAALFVTGTAFFRHRERVFADVA